MKIFHLHFQRSYLFDINYFLFQVATVISEATDIEKLSLMYEGWTAWV